MKICLFSLYFTEQALRPVPAGVENLIPLIQGAFGWMVHDVKFLAAMSSSRSNVVTQFVS